MPRAPKPKTTPAPIKNDHLEALRTRVSQAPTGPGIYKWKDSHGTIMYVGKAKNLRNRLRSYVNPSKGSIGPWKLSFLQQIADFEVTVTNSEIEALIFETNLIKELRPKYNVLMKDDKNYVYARVTVQDPFPRIESVRKIDPNDGAKYFGPMLSGSELWSTLTMLRKIFPFRTCKMDIEPVAADSSVGTAGARLAVPGPGSSQQKIAIDVVCKHRDRPTPCLDHHIGRCSAPCIGTQTPEEYRRECIEGVMQFLKGDYDSVKHLLTLKMKQAAMEKKFEQAAKLRDSLGQIGRMQKSEQIVSDTTGEDADVFAVAVLSGRAHVCVMRRRSGKVIGDECFMLQGNAESEEDVLTQIIPQYYADETDIPESVILSADLNEREIYEQWLGEKKGRKVELILPERGRKSHLLQLAEKNVQEKARQAEVKWEAETKNVEEALRSLAELLSLPSPPHRIEGYDISHLGGTETVGSMTVMINGKTANDHYRSFTIRSLKRGDVDDYQSLKEVLSRRLRHLTQSLSEEEKIWQSRGVTVGKAVKKDHERLREILGPDAQIRSEVGELACDDVYVVRHEGNLAACVRVFCYEGTPVKELTSLWVSDEMQGQGVETFLLRKVLKSVKKGKVYLMADPSLEDRYAHLGFRYVIKPPGVLAEILAKQESEKIVLMYEASQNKIDHSLSSRPDLIVIDGGKGQLGAVHEVMVKMGLGDVRRETRDLSEEADSQVSDLKAQVSIPVIGLAKREEEVFLPGHSFPIQFPVDSQAKFLLMRLRDEAHRFANRHRMARGRKASKQSILDEIPGVGEQTKKDLLKKFGTVSGIREASDEQLKEVVGQGLLKVIREGLVVGFKD